MKYAFYFVSCLLATLLTTKAESKFGMKKSPAPPAVPEYKEESPLPKGWPAPGPFYQVVEKNYPAYRAAFAQKDNPNGSFWKLFKHIERNQIPMSAPVEMKLDSSDASGMKMEQMSFIYQSTEVGKTGADGDQVEVRDVPACKVLSYAWQGPRNKESTARAREAIDEQLAKQNLKATGYRLLGYNSPFVPASKQTHELQALLKSGK
ncbi:MAG: heme-binding protein [Gloeobacteraceae cyanobacterium ES-bin-144]|nr:heme-binding protein [Verrucomicrobiales bacterium]